MTEKVNVSSITYQMVSVSLPDNELLHSHTWHLDHNGDLVCENGKSLARLIMEQVFPSALVPYTISHGDKNKLNNCRSNLLVELAPSD